MLFLSRIFPPAAIIFIIIGIVFFILRIRYVIQNAQLLASGFLVYLVYYYLFADHMRLGGKLVEVCLQTYDSGAILSSLGSSSCWSIPPCSWPPGCRCSWSICFSGWPTGKGMTAAPLLRCCLAYPGDFLPAAVPEDFGAFDGAAFSNTGHTGHMGGEGFHGTQGRGLCPGRQPPGPSPSCERLFRSSSDGGTTYVHPHVATNPDGILENNLSYHGPHPAPVSAGFPTPRRHLHHHGPRTQCGYGAWSGEGEKGKGAVKK